VVYGRRLENFEVKWRARIRLRLYWRGVYPCKVNSGKADFRTKSGKAADSSRDPDETRNQITYEAGLFLQDGCCDGLTARPGITSRNCAKPVGFSEQIPYEPGVRASSHLAQALLSLASWGVASYSLQSVDMNAIARQARTSAVVSVS
jgi:hypothetical protein